MDSYPINLKLSRNFDNTWKNTINSNHRKSFSLSTVTKFSSLDTYRKARRFVDGIMKDIMQEALEMDYKLENVHFNEEENTLEIKFETGTIEDWIITKREVL